MSAVVRQEIATAVSTVDGVTCFPYYRQTTKAGDAMVRLDRTEYPNRFGGVDTWQVLLLLPQDVATAEKYLETKVPPIRQALDRVVVIRRVTPSELVLIDGTRVPCVVIEGTREESE